MMAKIFVKWILDPSKDFTIDDVPQRWKVEVEKLIESGGKNNG